ncbi:PAPA-1-like conserved region-domain-containing protein [Radiomyces spectabilis]|uniref:PAPA-1-like conserved region-domain-containing protein n=1 Tax=Radiomyces spectabilis TaxID=64574 RepID=UPI00221EB39E|nr:PAPA-1-like conserved region-domain-containing protein [Radiomyces spectabilis]KAI8388705.1 PAPA-1-like conserved region-domain-containing protein [Radiomyces spectabilis]
MDEVVQNRPLTKRQRAKLNNETVEDYLELPMESGKKKLLTEEEEALRRSEVARRRKNQSIQRAEKDKEDTINRLLKKQASKSKRVIKDDGEDKEGQAAGTKQQEDRTRLHYVNNKEGSSLSIPMSHTIQEVFGNQPKPQVKGEARCEVEACNNLKKYVTKKTGKKVCSLEHYRLVESA